MIRSEDLQDVTASDDPRGARLPVGMAIPAARESRFPSGERPLRYSIRGRAALVTSVLVAVALAAFTWLTVTRMRADLIKRGIERAEAAVATLATQTSQSSQQGLNRLKEVARGSAVLSFLRAADDQT